MLNGNEFYKIFTKRMKNKYFNNLLKRNINNNKKITKKEKLNM